MSVTSVYKANPFGYVIARKGGWSGKQTLHNRIEENYESYLQKHARDFVLGLTEKEDYA